MIENKNRVFFATLPNGYFGSAGQSWLSLSIDKISKGLVESGCTVVNTPIDKLLVDYVLEESDIVIYTSCENKVVREYIKDIMYFANKKCTIIPSYDLLMAHENKGFQELYRLDKDFGDLDGSYHIDHEILPSVFPYIYKSITGAGSSGVLLVRNQAERNKILHDKEKQNIKRKVINFSRSKKLDTKQYSIYSYNKKNFQSYITQSFIEGLKFDYKVLVFWDKFYVLKRNIKDNDFRASGSGLFEFDKPSDELLNYAKEIFKKLNTPYASLDIAVSGSGCKLIEFQALNFGPYTLINSPGFYQQQNDTWSFVEGKSLLEDEFSSSLGAFIKNNNLLNSN